jgi:hypothetical protein
MNTPESTRRDKELQKEVSKHIRSWLNPRKHRTIPLLAKKTHLAETSLREYHKGETQVSPHRALAIVAVCNPEVLIDFIEKFLPEIFPPIQKSIDARAQKKFENSEVVKKITSTIFAEADISKSPIIKEMVRSVKSVFDDGLVAGSGKKVFIMGGISAGIVMKIGSSTFDRIAKILMAGESIKIEEEAYKLRAFDASYDILTLEKIEGRGWIFLCADRCRLFDETTKAALENHLKGNADAIQLSERELTKGPPWN